MMHPTFSIGESIARSKIESYPFRHLYVENLLPDNFYSYIVDNWPRLDDRKTVGELRGGGPDHWQRRRNVSTSEINPFWNRIDEILSPQLKRAVGDKFQIAARRSEMIVTVDDPMFKIGLHNDEGVPAAIIFLAYFPTGEEAGTNLHDENKEVAKYVPALPNTAFAFMPAKDTWHSVPESSNPRHKITFRIYG